MDAKSQEIAYGSAVATGAVCSMLAYLYEFGYFTPSDPLFPTDAKIKTAVVLVGGFFASIGAGELALDLYWSSENTQTRAEKSILLRLAGYFAFFVIGLLAGLLLLAAIEELLVDLFVLALLVILLGLAIFGGRVAFNTLRERLARPDNAVDNDEVGRG